MITEAFQLGDKDYRLPGLGSYMSVAAEQKNGWAQLYAIGAMIIMIVALDQFLWRPVTVWAQKFRVEESGSTTTMTSWFLDFLRHSRIVAAVTQGFWALIAWFGPKSAVTPLPMLLAAPAGLGSAPELTAADASLLAARPAGPSKFTTLLGRILSTVCLMLLIGAMLYGGYCLWALLRVVTPSDWLNCLGAGGVTLVRVLVSTVIGTIWAVPVGIMIGLSPRLSRLLQPVVQIVASFPAPMLFPAVIVVLHVLGISLNYGAVVLMLLGTQWYILFNVIAGSMAIPADLQEAAQSYNFSLLRRFKVLYIPAVFPYLVTGWVTASGGAWNASIVAEYYALNKDSDPLMAYGLGATISQAAFHENLPLLAAAIVVMSALVVAFNLSVWRRLYHIAESRYSLNK
ncbi:MAG: ABC transporter permease subunit [Phycisphaerae bacterium]